MVGNHTFKAMETIFELLPPGYCKAAILFHSHTFREVCSGLSENLRTIKMMTVRIIRALIIIISKLHEIINALWHKKWKVFFKDIFDLGFSQLFAYSQFNSADIPSQEKERGIKLSLDHNKSKWGARHAFDVGFWRGIFSVDVFPRAEYLINFQHTIRIGYFDRTQYFGTAIRKGGWFLSLCCAQPRGFCFKMSMASFQQRQASQDVILLIMHRGSFPHG